MKDKKVQMYLSDQNGLSIKHEVLEHPQLISVEAVQKYLGFGMGDSAATLVMKTDDNFVAIIRRGDTKLDSAKAKKHLGITNLRMATEAEFAEITGVPSGAAAVYIPNLKTYIDKKIFDKESINAGSGSLLYTFRYKTGDLKKIPGIEIVDFTTFENKDSLKTGVLQGKRIVSGITPSGDGSLHIGNYLGAVRQFIKLAKIDECFLMVADLHALTTVQDKKQLQNNVETLILDELALLKGFLPEDKFQNLVFFRQSDVPMHTELQSILNNVTPLGLIKRAHAYKDKLAKDVMEDEINLGLFNYPILMAADILLYKPDLVPVGKDQKQHIEITRDIAERFNKTYARGIFKLPEPYIPEEVAVVMGTDGKRKMSKSLRNIISIFDDEEVIKDQVTSTYTDPARIHANDPGNVEGNMVFTYLDFFGERMKVDEFKEAYRRGHVADIEVKNYLYESLIKYFAPARVCYEELKKNPNEVKKILENGSLKAKAVASQTMGEVREVIGLTNKYSISLKRLDLSKLKGPTLKEKMDSGSEAGMTEISIDEFARVEERVGKVIAAENVEKSEKLIRLQVDFGEFGKRIIFTGVRTFGYKPEDFTGKQFLFVTNLLPRKMMGEESQGMILAVDSSPPAGGSEQTKPIFVSAEGMPLGAKIR